MNFDIALVNLTTPVDFSLEGPRIALSDKLLTMGSCFSANVGAWLKSLQFDIDINPSAIIYNPFSIANHISLALADAQVDLDFELELSAGRWVHTAFHSSLASSDRAKAAANLQNALETLGHALRTADVLFITLGTSVVFESLSTHLVVNNCHKLPLERFRKYIADIDAMDQAMQIALNALWGLNPKINIYLTISPVRHLRHGAVVNQQSKSRLVLLAERLVNRFEKVHYIPVYEFVMDELRDYRFYRFDDLIHLNEGGLTLLKERLKEVLISTESQSLINDIERLNRMEQHRILNAEAAESPRFIERKMELRKKIESKLGRSLIY